METKLESLRKGKIVSLSDGVRIMFSQMDKFQHQVVSRDVAWATYDQAF
jgi:hypothetical protein